MNCRVKLSTLRKNVKKLEYPIALMVKANAYGHGMPLVRAVADVVTAFGVATELEGVRLREYTDKPILITAPNIKMSALYQKYALTPMVSDVCHLIAINEYSSRTVRVHLKVDSGMGRFGCKTLKETALMLLSSKRLPKVEISGICTHFSSIEAKDSEIRVFDRHIELAEHHLGRLLRHAAASGTSKGDKYDMRRIGFTAYSDVLTVTTTIASIKTLRAGEHAGYNGIYEAKVRTKIAIVYGGYADGIPRSCIGFKVRIREKYHPIVAVCMDTFIVELSCTAEVGDEVTVIKGLKSVLALAEASGRIPYEIYVGLTGRCKFEYIE